MKLIAIFNKDTGYITRGRIGKNCCNDTPKGRIAAELKANAMNSKASCDLYEVRDCTIQQLAAGK